MGRGYKAHANREKTVKTKRERIAVGVVTLTIVLANSLMLFSEYAQAMF